MNSLFDRVKIGNIEVKNRFIRSATCEKLSDSDGHNRKQILFDYYEDLAKGGVGTIISSFAKIDKNEIPSINMMGIYDDSFIEEYKKLTSIIHKYDTKVIMQIVYGGSQSKNNSKDNIVFGPSSIKNPSSNMTPIEMTKDNIKYIIQKFIDAAVRAEKSGFDGVQLHIAHGYLLSQFLSPYFNRRKDEYGGNIENRGRIIYEIYEGIRSEAGKNFIISVKINSDNFIDEDSYNIEECIEVCETLDKMGIDLIEISGGMGCSRENEGAIRKVKTKDDEAYFRENTSKVANIVDSPVAIVGGLRSIDIMEDIINKEKIEFISMSRPLHSEPDLINKWKLDKNTKLRCISCNQCNKGGKICVFR
ncbi:NADH:flavin oxidoreductase [Romboutsia weinsteinii]|uniref:NADH:flavin oxidoreductase n=1 Tax=Romboutsia weinsteinii TaxID=2020949 RepID=A0A371J5W4_9FIRM|nr:NADH:flavin oxidoreductase [Romboutsia weinsteinii]RDY28067.1 NADH:flavin oxidoreductase [Romboutsia weinsteinii]